MAGAKDGGKEKKSGGKEESTTLLRRLAEEVAALRAEVAAVRSPPLQDNKSETATFAGSLLEGETLASAMKREIAESLTANPDAALFFAHAYQLTDNADLTIKSHDTHLQSGIEGILKPTDTQVARLGQAFSSAPKVALLRALLREGSRSAAQLGESAGLSTGSLYHHLRELTHAEVISAAGRNRFELTDHGRQAVLLLFTLAGRI